MDFEIKHLEAFDGFLFDLDGTLVDSMSVHTEAWFKALAAYGLKIGEPELLSLAGTPNVRTVEIFNERYGWELDPVKVASQKDLLFEENLHLVSPIEEVVRIAQDYYGKKPMAIVSGSTREMVKKTLATIGLLDFFEFRVCAEDVFRGKPHPEPFLKGARLIQIPPERCLVFEDGEAGIKSALSAGMQVVKVEGPTVHRLIRL